MKLYKEEQSIQKTIGYDWKTEKTMNGALCNVQRSTKDRIRIVIGAKAENHYDGNFDLKSLRELIVSLTEIASIMEGW